MSCHSRLPVAALSFLLLTGSVAAGANGLYRWLDEQGQPHFSDRPPTDGQAAEQLRRPSFAPPRVSPDQDPYSILNQAKRLEARREAIELARRERLASEREYRLRQRQIELQQQAMRTPPATSPAVVYRQPRHRPLPAHRRHWHGYRRPNYGLWKPDHPAYRP